MTKQVRTAKTFPSFHTALAWARSNARESCHFFHFWRVETLNQNFVVSIRSKNTGLINGYAI